MQTLRLPAVVLRDLRAISSGLHPGRRPTPSQRTAAIWKGAQPLPNHPSPTLAVGLLSTARRGGMRGDPCLSNSPVWAPPVRQRNAPPERFQDAVSPSAVGPRPAASCPQPGRCPPLGAGLLRAAPLRERHGAGPRGAGTVQQVCRWQTARAAIRKLAPCAAQVPDTPHVRARRSATLRAASDTLSFGRRPQLCQRAPRSGERSGGQTTTRSVASCGVFTKPCLAVQYAASSVVAG
jgi:hypothetical protein